ncbi:MAG: protein translocase subunit SecF [Candidatus Marinimicrobia bacterium]|nr:protein translocase subunit SecF [Candidatus Neomarinimicrobiota bacterium]|tara:strand:- start:3109 stop:3990 length:882 start_codon:yes stop_codon:yes gene_type:complete
MRIFNKTNIDFVGKSAIAKFLSMALIIAGLASLVMKGGPELSIDFTGGTIAQLQFNNAVDVSELRSTLAENGFESSEIITFGSPNEVLIKTQFSGANSELESNLRTAIKSEFQVRRVESVGPKIGKELQSDALSAILLSLLLILVYISFRFDRFYAYGSVVALIHDVLITMGVFSLLSIEIDLTIVAAFLTIVGYSLNDTIVVFDRIRENVIKHARESLDTIVNISLNSTLGRTVVTSLTTFVVVLSLFLFGGEVIKNFAFALIVGIFVGTYSSIYVASPVMMYFEKKALAKK